MRFALYFFFFFFFFLQTFDKFQATLLDLGGIPAEKPLAYGNFAVPTPLNGIFQQTFLKSFLDFRNFGENRFIPQNELFLFFL